MPDQPGALAAMIHAAGLPNIVIGDDGARLIPDPSGELRIHFEGPTDLLKAMTVGSLLLKAGMSPHAPHKHPEEEFMVVSQGTGEIFVDGRTTNVGPGSIMYCAAEKYHGITNTGGTPMLFYFFKWLA